MYVDFPAFPAWGREPRLPGNVGGGVVTAPGAWASVDVRVRMLIVHLGEDFRERGVSVSLRYDPRQSTPFGFMAKLSPSWGGPRRRARPRL